MRNYVLAITPNPSLDLSGAVDALKPNEKSYVHDEIWSPGGNAINAARILTRLKVPVLATGFLGGGTGEEIKMLLENEGVRSQFVRIEDRSRISVTVSNQFDHKQTRLSFPGPRINKREKSRLIHFFKREQRISFMTLGGSLPPGFQPLDVIRLMKLARKRKIASVIDCPGSILREIIAAGPLLIKPNLDEFQEFTRSQAASLDAVRREASKWLDKAPYICVSSVEGGALLVTRNRSFFGRIPKIRIRSTVGAGDSMVGALVAQLYRGNSSGEDLLRWGLAASAATLAHAGTAMGKASEIHRIYAATKVKAL